MKNSLVKFQKQNVTIYDKNGKQLINPQPKRKNKILFFSLIGLALLSLGFFISQLSFLFENKETKQVTEQTIEVIPDETVNNPQKNEVPVQEPVIGEEYDKNLQELKKQSENCGIVMNKGVKGDNYWVEIKDNKTGQKVKIDDLPSFVWEHTEIGYSEICN